MSSQAAKANIAKCILFFLRKYPTFTIKVFDLLGSIYRN